MINILLIKALILFTLLMFASIRDIRTHEVSNIYSILIGLTALIGISLEQVLGMLLSAVIITIPIFGFALFKPGGIGGADIKLTAACSFLLGLQKGLLFIIIGLSLAVLCNLAFKILLKDRYKEPFALVPYLSMGCMAAYLL
jgi:leader peptidase (prepilin peptidase)/N-methyltransferase